MVHGRCYHAVSTLLPGESKAPSHGQLYIFDPKEANDKRMSTYSNLERPVLDNLASLLEDVNPYAKLYKQMHHILADQDKEVLLYNVKPQKVVLRFHANANADPRRYTT